MGTVVNCTDCLSNSGGGRGTYVQVKSPVRDWTCLGQLTFLVHKARDVALSTDSERERHYRRVFHHVAREEACDNCRTSWTT